MGRYHLRLENDILPIGDVDGQEFADDASAIKEAGAAAAEMLRDELSTGAFPVHVRVLVRDEAQQLIATVVVQGTVER